MWSVYEIIYKVIGQVSIGDTKAIPEDMQCYLLKQNKTKKAA